MSRKILLHVGTPKTGTSYVQDVLFRNQRTLLKHGILYPADRHDAHFLAALDLMRMPWGGLETEAIGAWDALAERVRRPGTTILSHEVLATASRSQVGRALTSLGDAEVHLVLSVRDLVRQIPAEWQENVKHRASLTYEWFLQQIRDPERSAGSAAGSGGCRRCRRSSSAGRTTSRRSGCTSSPCRRRAARPRCCGSGSATPSTSTASTSTTPRTHQPVARRPRDRPHPADQPAANRLLARPLPATGARAARPPDPLGAPLSPPAGPPARPHAWVAEVEQTWVDAVRDRGYDVVGDLGDLLGPRPEALTDPDAPRRRPARRRSTPSGRCSSTTPGCATPRRGSRASSTRPGARSTGSHAPESYRAREKAVRRLQTSGAGRALLTLYRVVRGRNSRSA